MNYGGRKGCREIYLKLNNAQCTGKTLTTNLIKRAEDGAKWQEHNVCIICCKCLNPMAPTYLSESLKLYVPARQLRSSADQTTLVVPYRNLKSSVYRSFHPLGPRLWNNLSQKKKKKKKVEKHLQLTFLKTC